MPSRGAKSVRGVWGNLRFIIGYKLWATLVVFGAGIAVGGAIFGGLGS